MKKEVKDIWVSALRSGKYKQARDALTDGDGMCCLGVLCDLHREQTGQGNWENREYVATTSKGRKAAGSETPPVPVCEWAGLKSPNPDVPNGDDLYKALSDLNDSDRLAFPKIADLIDQHWETM